MELRNSSVLLLGGSGLVGMAIGRRLLQHQPRRIVIAALDRAEAEAGAGDLRSTADNVEVEAVSGNIFLSEEASMLPRGQALVDPRLRRSLVEDILAPASPAILQRNVLYRWLVRFKPDVVIDCVNTATALAYQDVFAGATELLKAADAGTISVEAVERHILTLPLSQLMRHMQILVEGMRLAGTSAYVKIGTSGTGGMGFNVPYTHSEERPSRTLMAKSAVAGAQSLLLFLLARTPGAPATIEIKPTAVIGWREIAFGAIRRGGTELELVDCERPIPVDEAFGPGAAGWVRTGQPLESVFINVGENGVFARDEFETVTSLGQMELVTPEEIADTVVMELRGRPTGRNIVAALDGASMGPTYRGGFLRAVALDGLERLETEHGVRSIAFEMLGPPRLTKLLYEAYILSLLFPSIRALGSAKPRDTAIAASKMLLDKQAGLRRQILSVGLPILLPDGSSVLRGVIVVVPPDPHGADIAPRGWVDLRPSNMEQWIRRASAMCGGTEPEGKGSGARFNAVDPDAPIAPSRMAVWIFEEEDGGFRIKR